jgi:hypothetical protein
MQSLKPEITGECNIDLIVDKYLGDDNRVPRTMITTVVMVKNHNVYCHLRSFTIR